MPMHHDPFFRRRYIGPLPSSHNLSHILSAATHDFLFGLEDAHLAEADVEGRGEEGAVLLLHHDDVDGARQRRRVDLAVPLRDRLDQRVRYETHLEEFGGITARLSQILLVLQGSPNRLPGMKFKQ